MISPAIALLLVAGKRLVEFAALPGVKNTLFTQSSFQVGRGAGPPDYE